MPSPLLAYGDSVIQALGWCATEVASGFRNTQQKFPDLKIKSNQSINHLGTTSVTIHRAITRACVDHLRRCQTCACDCVSSFCRGSQAHHTYLTQRSNGAMGETQPDQLCVPALTNTFDSLLRFRFDKLVPPMYGVQNSCSLTVPHIPI